MVGGARRSQGLPVPASALPVFIAAYRPPPFLRVRSRLQQGRFSTRRTKTTRQPAGVMSGGRKRKNRPCRGGFFTTGLAGTPVNGDYRYPNPNPAGEAVQEGKGCKGLNADHLAPLPFIGAGHASSRHRPTRSRPRTDRSQRSAAQACALASAQAAGRQEAPAGRTGRYSPWTCARPGRTERRVEAD
ncbi:hypothetical protein XFF6992_10030 [Xanthomonas citri pv. fuscans]|uniref:Uncharacterized protein n=1 Tax=Xanthomonas campestris pv. phaseoli TaxID=317013 RepID=A0A7Z7IUV6_XANCH|nr:hypothetical protein XFF6990_210030 [Xanthomonas citri pv. fuscans]SOO17013.1 hypothetical protein XFF6992_10030 [Xanthomonas citri pv. fuscans]SOO22003.1 hypothetical protein XFF6991_10013 [Xanthomonas phaseoli pv. phaseoli]